MRDQRNSWHRVDFPYHSDLDVGAYYRRYCETLRSLDDSVGRLLAWLRERGLEDSTAVLYMSDDGFLFGEHGLIDKRVAYQDSIRVPMLLQCPGLVPAGRTVTQVVANIDVAPTLLELAGVPPPAGIDGHSFLALVRGEIVPWRSEFLNVYYWEKNFPQSPTVFALRGDRFKYTTYYGLWDCDELYDLAVDPAETRNLIDDPAHAATVRSMECRLYELMAEAGAVEIPLNPPMGPSANKRLGPKGGARAADFPHRWWSPPRSARVRTEPRSSRGGMAGGRDGVVGWRRRLAALGRADRRRPAAARLPGAGPYPRGPETCLAGAGRPRDVVAGRRGRPGGPSGGGRGGLNGRDGSTRRPASGSGAFRWTRFFTTTSRPVHGLPR